MSPTSKSVTSGSADQALLHQSPIALEKGVLTRRIYAPLAYAPVRNARVVPIVHSECSALASRFPLVWRRGTNGSVEFVAVRSLIDDQRGQPPATRALLPLILHAYPFMFDPEQPISPSGRRMLDDVFADHPTDAGAGITTTNGKLGRATTMRLGLLDRIAQEHALTQQLAESLAALDLLEPWPLSFLIEGQAIGIPDLYVVRPGVFEQAMPGRLAGELGMACAQMLGLHRLSLFCAGPLLAAARRFLKSTKTAAVEPVEATAQSGVARGAAAEAVAP
jgi:hypothetical protein